MRVSALKKMILGLEQILNEFSDSPLRQRPLHLVI
jgi:hypothetical protein